MTDSFNDIDDGVGRYASRTRVNRRVLTLTGDGTNSLNGTLDLNGKIAQIILDCTRVTCGSNTATGGSFSITMDIEDGDGDQEYPYCNTVSSLDVRSSIATPHIFQIAEGANTDTAGVHLTVTSPGGVAASWCGHVCGQVRFTVATSNSTFSAGTIRVIVIHE